MTASSRSAATLKPRARIQTPPAGAQVLAFHRRPDIRQRLIAAAGELGPDTLHDAEVLMLQFAPGDRRRLAERAQRLVERFGGLAGVLAADRGELARHVSGATIVNLKLLREIASRVAVAGLSQRPLISSFGAAADFFRARLRGLPREEFWVVYLDRKNQLIEAEQMSVGTVDHAPVYVREVMRRALETGASALIIAHNHPSGDPTPSPQDIEMTRSLAAIGRLLNVTLHDHMIVGAEKVESLSALGLMSPPKFRG